MTAATYPQVQADLKPKLPPELVDALLASYDEIKRNSCFGRHEPSELNGGKFCEACFRIIQYQTNAGSYTDLGTHIPDLIGRLRDFEKIPANGTSESYRIHIPRVLIAMYNIRNKRGVGHLGGDVNPNAADSGLLVACADWVTAELFRIHYQCSLGEAQRIANSIVQRRLALVHQLENVKRVLLPSLPDKDQTLLILASIHPQKASDKDLVAWIEPSNKSRYLNNVLRCLHDSRLIEYGSDGFCEALPNGLKYIESKCAMWLNKLNEES